MSRTILALAGAAIVATLAVAITSRRPNFDPASRTAPAPATAVEPEVSGSYASTPRYDADVPHSPHSGTNADGTSVRDGSEPADGVALVPRAKKPRKAAGPSSGSPLAPRTSGTETEFLSDALFRRLDADGDGVLSGAEIPTALRGAANGRGSIDRETFTKVFVSTVQKLRASNAATQAWFESLDTDRDGRVSLAEWRAAGRSVADFERIDTDGNGVLTLSEVQAFAAQSGPAAPTGGTTPAASSAASATPADGAPQSPTAATTTRTGTKPPSRADTLFAHYTAVASGSQPSSPRVTAAKVGGAASAPVKPAAAPATVPATAPAAAPAAPSAAPHTAAPAPAPAPLPPGEYATLPMPFTGVTYWEQRNTENQNALLAGERPSVLFLGDSITDFLRTGAGKPLWDDYYAPLGALDFAIGGIRTSHVLWQLETGQVLAANPQVVVLLIGSNNLGLLNQPPEEVAAGIETIVDELGVQLPNTRVLLLGILPRGYLGTDPLRYKIAKVNGLIAGLQDGGRVTYRDIGLSFMSRDWSISPDVMPDGVHPSLFGYLLYSIAIWPTLTDLLKR